jgi:hypothetical protein
MTSIKRAAFTIAAAATILTGATAVGVTNAHAAGGCHPHPEVCEAEALSGTDHYPADRPTHGVCTLGPLEWMCAINLGRTVR